jgi:uncharacterized membrane protein YkoI
MKTLNSGALFAVSLCLGAVLVFGADQSVQISLGDAPTAIQKSIKSKVGKGKIAEITKVTEDGEVAYEVRMTRDGKTRTFVLDDKGKVAAWQVFLPETPPPAQKAIRALLAGGRVVQIDKRTEEGKPVFDVEMLKDNRQRSFTVRANGELASKSAFLNELPDAVQKAIKTALGTGKLGDIEEQRDGGTVKFEVEITRGDSVETLTYSPEGKILEQSLEVKLSATPAAVQRAVQSQLGGGKVESIGKTIEAGKATYEVEIVKGERTLTLSLGADGRLLQRSEEIAISDAPEPVQKALKVRLSGGDLDSISRVEEDGETTYDVEFTRDEKSVIVSFSPDGKIVLEEEEVSLADTPAAVQAGIKALLGDGELARLVRVTEDGDITYEGEMEKDGKPQKFTVGPDGKPVVDSP